MDQKHVRLFRDERERASGVDRTQEWVAGSSACGELTGLLVDDGAGTREVAGHGRPALALVVAVERVGGVRSLGVRLEARAAGLDRAAVGAVSARVVQRRL